MLHVPLILVFTAERLPHDTGTVLSEAPAACVSAIVFAGEPGLEHWKPGDPVHCVVIVLKLESMAHV